MITAIRATSRTLADFLTAEFKADPDLGPFFGGGGTMRVLLNTPAEMSGARSGLSIWLYRVTRDDATLNRPPERIGPTTLKRAPLPVRLHYLISPITGAEVDDATATEQVILGKVLQVLHEHPQLSGADLTDDFQGTTAVVTARFEGLNVDELSRIWDALDRPYRTSISYEVTVVDIEARVRDEVGPPVQVPMLDPVLIVGGPCMSRSTVVTGGRAYTVSNLESRARGEVHQAIVTARIVDDATDLPVTAPTRISGTLAGLVPVAASGGYVGLAGRPTRVVPNLRLQPYPVQVTIDADGYLPWSDTRPIPQEGGFPGQFAALLLGDIRLRRAPVVVTVSTVRLDGANRLVALPGANVAVNGVWRQVKDLRNPPVSATLLALDPGLSTPRPSGASVDVPTLTLPPEAKRTLLAGVRAGDRWLSVSRRGSVTPGDLVALVSTDPGRVEYVEVAAVQGSTDPESPSRFELEHPLARAHVVDTDVRRVVAPGPAVGPAGLTAAAVAGATTVEVTSLAGIAAGSVVRVSGGATAPEYRIADHYSVTTNADGAGHLPPLAGYVAARVVASAAALGATAKVTLTHPPPSLDLTLT